MTQHILFFTCPEIVEIEQAAALQQRPATLARERDFPGQIREQRNVVLQKQAEFEANPGDAEGEALALAREKLRGLTIIAEAAGTISDKLGKPVLTKETAALFAAAFAKRFDAITEREAAPRAAMADRVAHLIRSGFHPLAACQSAEVGVLNQRTQHFAAERQAATEARHWCSTWTPVSHERNFADLLEHVTRPIPGA